MKDRVQISMNILSIAILFNSIHKNKQRIKLFILRNFNQRTTATRTKKTYLFWMLEMLKCVEC